MLKILGVADDGTCEGGLFPPGISDFKHAEPSLKFAEPKFGEALLSVYLDANGIVPEAREQWAQAAKSLLDGSKESGIRNSEGSSIAINAGLSDSRQQLTSS